MVRTAQDFGWLLLTGWQNTPLAVIVATPTLWPVRRSPLTRTMAGGVVARRSRVDAGPMDTTSPGLMATLGGGVDPTRPAQLASGTARLRTVAVSEESPQVEANSVVVVTAWLSAAWGCTRPAVTGGCANREHCESHGDAERTTPRPEATTLPHDHSDAVRHVLVRSHSGERYTASRPTVTGCGPRWVGFVPIFDV